MKQVIAVLAMVLLLCVPTAMAGEKKHKPQTFQVTFSVTYNRVTLAEAASREKQIIKNHPEACKIKGKVSTSNVINRGDWVVMDNTFTMTE